MKLRLGSNESVIYTHLVSPKSPRLLTPKDTIRYLTTSTSRTGVLHALSLLERKGALERLGKGLYLNKSTGIVPRIVDVVPDVFRDNPYYIGLNAAANHWGLTPQIPYAYHAVYVPKDEAESKRVVRWCTMLEKKENVMGGILVPVKSRMSRNIISGISQTILEGSQLPISGIERTLIDATIYTEEIGAVGEALLWFRSALSSQQSFNIIEFRALLKKVRAQIKSVGARIGFILERTLRMRTASPEVNVEIGSLLEEIQGKMIESDTSYSWGPKEDGTVYFERWHLHVSRKYLNQLRV